MNIEEKVIRKVCDIQGDDCHVEAHSTCEVCGLDLCNNHDFVAELQSSWYATSGYNVNSHGYTVDSSRDLDKTLTVCESCLDLARAEFKAAVRGAMTRLKNLFGGSEDSAEPAAAAPLSAMDLIAALVAPR